MKLLVVVNAAAGTAEQDAVDAALGVLKTGADVRIEATADLDALRTVLTSGNDGRTPVVIGGDGSLHAAVQVLHDAGALGTLGLIPLGTGNDLARTLGIPIDPVSAAEKLLTATPRTLDLAVDDTGTVLVNAAHAGVGAEAARKASGWKPALGAAAYPLGGVAAGVAETGWALTVSVDGVTVHEPDEPVLMVAVMNGRSIGGGAQLAPDAEPDDGALDVVISTATGPLARAGYAIGMRSGEHVGRDDVTVHRGRTIIVAGEPFAVNTDGELDDDVSTRTWTIQPAAWSVLAPVSDMAAGSPPHR